MRVMSQQKYTFWTLYTTLLDSICIGRYLEHFTCKTKSPTDISSSLTYFRAPVIKCTSARQTYKCTPTTTAKTRPSFKRASSGSEPRRSVEPRIVPSLARGQPTSTAGETLVSSRSRIKRIWVGWKL